MSRPALVPALLIGLAAATGALAQGNPAPSNAPVAGGFPPLPTAKPPPLGATPQPAVAGKPGAPPPGQPGGRMLSSGTGFVVAPGRALTNAHVVEECRGLRVRAPGGADLAARVIVSDRERDLALIEVPDAAGPPLAFRVQPECCGAARVW
jgi:S1-C subfamily serine protease